MIYQSLNVCVVVIRGYQEDRHPQKFAQTLDVNHPIGIDQEELKEQDNESSNLLQSIN